MNHHILYSVMDSVQKNGQSSSGGDPTSKRRFYEACVFLLNEVYAEIVNEQTGEISFVGGVLKLVEKEIGVFVEWMMWLEPDENPDNTWVIEGAPTKSENRNNSPNAFSADIKELRSYKIIQAKEQPSCIQFFYKDGHSSAIYHFRGGGHENFVVALQRYTSLSRSAKEKDLVLLTDCRMEALEQSVFMLNMNKDIVSRFLTNPYATSMTTFAKISNLMAPMLDPDSMINEQQIREIKRQNQTQAEEETEKLRRKPFRSHNESGFEHVFINLQLPPRPRILSSDMPVDGATWRCFCDADGHVNDVHGLKSLIFRGGIVREMRPTIWKYMLDYYKWNQSDAENKKMRKNKEEEYYRMKLQWMSISEDQQRRFSDFRDRKALIDKDVARTDRSHPFFNRSQLENLQLLKDILMTYCMYDFDLGYVQGMSDFLSPLLVVLENEVDAFWCFAGLMNRVHKNFEMDQLDIRKQLSDLKSLIEVVNPRLANYFESHDSEHMYFCFRWILVCFKREFSFDQIMYLWEVLWTDIPCKSFLLLFCVAILDGQINMIIENKFGLTEILKHVNSLSMKIDLEKTLRSAEAIYHQLAAVQDKLPRHICEILSFSVDEESGLAGSRLRDV